MFYKVFYTKPYKWLYGKADGKTFGNIIFIKKSFKNDKCLLAHELEHVRQNYKRKWFNKCQREKGAYMVQWKCLGFALKYKAFINSQIKKYCD